MVLVEVAHPGPELQSDQREKGEIFHQFTVQGEHFIRLATDWAGRIVVSFAWKSGKSHETAQLARKAAKNPRLCER